MGDLLGISGKYVGMIERGEKTIEEQSSLGLLFRAHEASAGLEEESRYSPVLREDPPIYRVKGTRPAARRMPEMPAAGDTAIAGEGSVRGIRGSGYDPDMISLTADSSALAAHLLKAMPRDEVFKLLRDLTRAGESGDDAALRKARALLDLLPTTHPTATAAEKLEQH